MNSPGRQDALDERKRAEKVLTLFRHVGRLDDKIDFEHSFKAAHDHLFDNRFLLGVSRRETKGSRDEWIVLISRDDRSTPATQKSGLDNALGKAAPTN
jgi:hypothetical protein